MGLVDQINELTDKVMLTKRWALAKGVTLRGQVETSDMDGPVSRAFDALVEACNGVLPEEVSEKTNPDQRTPPALEAPEGESTSAG